MFTMKDGSEVTDRRLGCLFDPRPRPMMASVTTLFEAGKPRSYTWRCSKVLDQGSQGSCVGHGFAHRLISRPVENLSVDHKYATEQIYYPAQKRDPWPGGSYPGAKPFYEGTTVEAGAEVLLENRLIKGSYPANDLTEMILGIGYQGPAVIGVNWYEGMSNTDSDGFIHATGDLSGGHCVCLTGVQLKKKYFFGANSWGTGWGQKGFFKISFADMEKLIDKNGTIYFVTDEKLIK